MIISITNSVDDELKEYRVHLVEARQKAFDDFDKTVLALSAGALGVSITFLKDLIGAPATSVRLLFFAWICWGISLVSVLLSYFVSQLTLDKAISQIDSGSRPNKPGGRLAVATKMLNACGGILFLVGLIVFIAFISQNMEVFSVKPK